MVVHGSRYIDYKVVVVVMVTYSSLKKVFAQQSF